MSRGNGDIAELAYRARHLLKYHGRLAVRPKDYDSRNANFKDARLGPVYLANANAGLLVTFDRHVVMSCSSNREVQELHQEFLQPALDVLRKHMVLQDLADV